MFAFVYAKNKEVKVLSLDEAKAKSENLLSKGWALTNTINPLVFISHLCKSDDSTVLDEIKSLKNDR